MMSETYILLKIFLYFIVMSCYSIYGKESAHTNRKAEKMNDCERCKVMTESFSYWMGKTARGKFEGGDAAWEEAKLKSYSRSEVRLVEIQEGMCSELKKHKDHCYTIAEETESILEKWWFQDDPHSADIFTWLCIETLQHCCPKSHYGPSCSPCLADKADRICTDHGKCDGDGTRSGNGTCICQLGYNGRLCELCAKDYYNIDDECMACHRACKECTSHGAESCVDCKDGWQKESGTCVDINECISHSVCSDNEYCVNKEGSYTCKLCDQSCKTCVGNGPTQCSQCESHSVLWSGRCINDDLKNDILKSILIRIAKYSGLLSVSFIVFRNSKLLTSITVLVVAVNMYFSEKNADFMIIDVISNMYLK